MWPSPILSRFLCVLLAGLALAGAAASQTPKPESKPAAPKPKAGRQLPPLFAPRADIAAIGKENGATMLSEAAVADGLEWLARHQEPDGSWSCQNFRQRCEKEGYKCGGKGVPLYDVTVSSVALLAFLGAGNTEQSGRYRDTVANGMKWLKSQQDARGLFGTTEDHRYPFAHAVAMLATIENAILSGSSASRDSAVKAIAYAGRPGASKERGWHYSENPQESDSTVTAFMVLALKAAQAGQIRSTDESLRLAGEFIRRITDEKTSQTGFLAKGDQPVKFEAHMKGSPPAGVESTTACGMTVRLFCGDGTGQVRGQAGVLLAKAPEWNPADRSVDFFYWHFATIAMFQMGGPDWQGWWQKMKEAALTGQQKGNPNETCQRGSWDPIDPWSTQGGRIYATAMMVLCLETPYRFGRLYATK